jgi:heme a synthase
MPGMIASSNARVDAPPRITSISHMPRVARFAWATLFCNVAVVLWGAYVRATGSGAGCGNRWPVCGGDILGANARTQTVIEFTHRATSGIVLVMVCALVIWCWRATRKGARARYSALLAAAFLANEALLGAALVLLGHVAQDQSSGRILFLCLHFGNTLLLLAMLALTASWLSKTDRCVKVVRKPGEIVAIGAGLFATMTIGITGAIAALADTLFPATSLPSSLAQDFNPGAPILLHLRLIHPVVAVVATAFVLWVIFKVALGPAAPSQAAIALGILFFTQIVVGIVNVVVLAPVGMQILHLGIGDLLWITLVLVSADLLFEPRDGPETAAARV